MPRKHYNPLNPYISVVVPAYNESAFLRATLDSLAAQDYKDFELIVVDNNSADDTAEIARSFGARVLFEPRQGVAHARQSGFSAAAGQIIASTDADTAVPRHWLSAIVKKFQGNNDLAAYGGVFRLYSGPRLTRRLLPAVMSLLWKADFLYHKGWSLPGSNMAVRKSSFLQVGGFNTALKLREDADLAQRLKSCGVVIMDKELSVQTSGRRYRKGLLAAGFAYLPGMLSQVLFKKQFANTLPPVRKESLSAIAFLPLALSFYILGFLILPYFVPSLHAKEAEAKTVVVARGKRVGYAARHGFKTLFVRASAEYHEADGK